MSRRTNPASGLNERQERFAREYLVDLVGTAAAIRAGYSEKTAEQQASRLLSNVKVQGYIDHLKEQQARRLEITADAVLKELAAIGFANMGEYVDFGPDGVRLKSSQGMCRQQLTAVSEVQEIVSDNGSVRRRIKLHDKRAALHDLGQHLGIFKQEQTEQIPTVNVKLVPVTEEDLKNSGV